MAGREDYIADVARRPTYHDGTPRKPWEQLSDVAKWSWERGNKMDNYEEIQKLWNKASYHYADDTVHEWNKAQDAEKEAYGLMMRGKWSADDIRNAHKEIHPIMPADMIINGYIRFLLGKVAA